MAGQLLPGKKQHRLSGRPKAGRRADFGAFQVAVRPKAGPKGLLRNIEYLLSQRSKNSYFKKSDRKSSMLGIETAIFLLKTHQRRWGAKPPTCARGF